MTGKREAARLGMEALDQVLLALGQQPVHENPQFHVADPVVGDLPNVVLEKPAAAPLRFVFGQDLDVWVGPFSEVVLLRVSEATKGIIHQQIERILLSSVACQAGKKSMVITLQLPDSEPWLRLKVRASGQSSALEPYYAPYLKGRSVWDVR